MKITLEIDPSIGFSFFLPTCQEDEEKPCAVKEDKFQKKDDTNEPLGVAGHDLVHDEVEHGVEVDGDEAHGDAEDVVDVVQAEEVSAGGVAHQQVDDLHAEDEGLVEQQQLRCQHHQLQVPGRKNI